VKHLDMGNGAMCGLRGEQAARLEDVDCERCLWVSLADVQNGLTVLLARLHVVTKANRVQVINPVARKEPSNG
jgi:hypothetical protein